MKPFLFLVTLAATAFGADADPFADHVRKTERLTPSEERDALKVPEGFEVQLFASEPEIGKPLNMAFDDRGRLWVSISYEYPYPAPLDQAQTKDIIKILEDTDGDGIADRFTTFADNLNVPIAVLPYRNGVICWSIPNIWFLEDTDGDDKADKRTKLYGPLGWERDTHGMIASFRRGLDGWLYGTHGYNNNSTFNGADGSTLTLQSGNTYRIRLDGSRVEPHTFGQVNPFGMTSDLRGNWYTVDCHSAPIYQLIPGAYYPSFGKPHDGLGFAPTMINHTHSSTGLCGIVYLDNDEWPEAYRDNILIGNVLTCRVNRDAIQFQGSSPHAVEMPDLIQSEDPWFRPVDLQMGPDGALYVADFYNRIIGHYEVPLDHPGRDRVSGRIWRIVYTGNGKAPGRLTDCDFSHFTPEALITELGSPSRTRRHLALDCLEDRHSSVAPGLIKAKLDEGGLTALQRAHGLWLLFRLQQLTETELERCLTDTDPLVRVHALHLLSETAWGTSLNQALSQGLTDSDANIQRAALLTLSQHPAWYPVSETVKLVANIPNQDAHLLHTGRLALRNQLRSEKAFSSIPKDLQTQNAPLLNSMSRAIGTADSAAYLLGQLKTTIFDFGTTETSIRHAAQFGSTETLDAVVTLARSLPNAERLHSAILEGLGGRQTTKALNDWGAELATNFLKTLPLPAAWSHNAVEPATWQLEERASSDQVTSPFFTSLRGGEDLMGTLQSQPFALPAHFSFWLAGHDGFPGKDPKKVNLVELILTDTQERIASASPPRNDIAQRVEWDLTPWIGKQAVLRVTDGDNGDAYAWLAIGRFSEPALTVPNTAPWDETRKGLALLASLKLASATTAVREWYAKGEVPVPLQKPATTCLNTLESRDPEWATVADLLGSRLPDALRDALRPLYLEGTPESITKLLEASFRMLPSRGLRLLAIKLAESQKGLGALVDLCERGHAPAHLLLDRTVASRLDSLNGGDLQLRAKRLTESLPSPDARLQQMIAERQPKYLEATRDPVHGQTLFTTYCAVCHQIGGQGGLIGPQLDGIGNRGLERLLEDVLDPSRQIDPGFRAELITLKDGSLQQGLLRREEGQNLILADPAGQEFRVNLDAIASRQAATISLMPPAFGDALTEADFFDLMAYLLTQR